MERKIRQKDFRTSKKKEKNENIFHGYIIHISSLRWYRWRDNVCCLFLDKNFKIHITNKMLLDLSGNNSFDFKLWKFTSTWRRSFKRDIQENSIKYLSKCT